jgi:DNA-binding phage protein
MLDGDFGTAKILLRDVINATAGFARLASRTGVPEKSLMRMFGPTGNPRAENLIAVVAALKEECGLTLTVRAVPHAERDEVRDLMKAQSVALAAVWNNKDDEVWN